MFPDDTPDNVPYVVPSDPTLSGPQRHILGGSGGVRGAFSAAARAVTERVSPNKPKKYQDPNTLYAKINNDWAKQDQEGRRMFIRYHNQAGQEVTAQVLNDKTHGEGVNLEFIIEVKSGRRTFTITWHSERDYPAISQCSGPPATDQSQEYYRWGPPGDVTYFFESDGKANEDFRSAAELNPFATPPTTPEATGRMEDEERDDSDAGLIPSPTAA